jgi:hypothetical protein
MAQQEYGKVLNNQILEYDYFEVIDDQTLLPPNKPRWYLVVEVNAAYDPVTQVREGPTDVIDNAALQIKRTYSTRGKNTAEIDSMRNQKLANVRAQADLRLTKIGTVAQQIWALTRLVQMLYSNTDWHSWPQAQVDLATTMLSRLNNMVQVRQVEDSKQAELQVLTDPVAINNYDVTTGWPT